MPEEPEHNCVQLNENNQYPSVGTVKAISLHLLKSSPGDFEIFISNDRHS
jgi:hypothetical protein